MARLSAKEIREAFRQLPTAEQEQLLADLMADALPDSDADLKAVEAALDRMDRGEYIRDADLAAYMERRRRERANAQG